jgi:hypothetical protein
MVGAFRAVGSFARGWLRIVGCPVAAALMLALWPPGAVAAARWSIQRTANPAGRKYSDLFGVSCPSKKACMAVGDVAGRAGAGLTLAEHWNGVSWSIQRTPNPASTSGVLGGLEDVSCTSETSCTATGSVGALALAEFWNGLMWSVQPTPGPGLGGDLQGVSCASIMSCTAVGWSIDGTALAEGWDGLGWSAQQTPRPAGGSDSALVNVSCATATACIAVGSTHRAGTEVTLAERWDGTSWAIPNTPNPVRGRGNVLNSVSCVSMTDCTAVGEYAPHGGPTVPLAEHWDGFRWALQKTATPKRGKDTLLLGVSCASASACVAVGTYTDGAGTEVTLAERWGRTRWTVQETPNPPQGKYSRLNGISCATATSCIAVGNFTNRWGTDIPLAEQYS